MREIKNCKICGKQFKTYQKSIYCSRDCRNKDMDWRYKIALARRQEWKGTSKQVTKLARWEIRRHNIPLVCVECKATEGLHIHHKNANRQDNQIENLEVLCNPCHQKRHEREKCGKCGCFLNEHHICQTEEQKRISAYKMLAKRERCIKCGKLMGLDISKHSCKHPRGMFGKHHTEEVKKRISETIKKKSRYRRKSRANHQIRIVPT